MKHTKERYEDDIALECSGRRINPNGTILGLTAFPRDGDHGVLFEGYDNRAHYADDYDYLGREVAPLTPDERREIADHMIARWEEWARWAPTPSAQDLGEEEASPE